ISIFSLDGFAQLDTDGAMRIFHYTDYFYTNNNDEWGTDEHTWYYYRREAGDALGNGNGWNQSICYARNCGGGCYGYPGWGDDRTYNQSSVPTQFRMRGRYWEDDHSGRCSYDTHHWYHNTDDDYNNWEQQYNVRQGCPFVWTYYGWRGSYWRNVHYTRTYYTSPRPDYATANNVSGTLNICGAAWVTLRTNGRQCGSSRYYWYRNGTYIGNTTSTAYSVYVSSNSTYTVYTNDQGANSYWNRSVIVNISTAASGSAGSNITQCGTGLITTNGASAANYSSVAWSWSGSSATLSNNTSLNGWTLQPVAASGSGTLTLTIYGISPCANITRTRTVAWDQQSTGSAGGNINQCFSSGLSAITMTGASTNGYGNTVTGTWSTQGGTGTGNWSQNTGNPAAATFTPTSASGSRTMRLRVQATSGYCTGVYNDYTRTVAWSSLTVSAGAPVSQCTNNVIVTSDASVSGLYSSLSWAYTSSTGTAALTNNTSLTGATLTPSTTSGSGTLTLTVVGTSPCPTVVATKSVQWSSGPLANAGATIDACSGSGTGIPMTGATGGGLTGNPAWTGGASLGTWSGSGTNPATYVFTPNGSNPSGSFTATLTVTGVAPCTGTATSTRLVRWNTPPTASAGSTINSCSGTSSITLSGSSATGTYSSVNWASVSGSGTGTFTNGGTNPALWIFNPTSATGSLLIRLTVTGSGYCAGTNPTSTRTINWGSIAASSPATINSCGMGTITMSGSTASTSGAFSSVAWTGQSGGSWTTTHATNPAAWIFTPSASSGNFTATLTVTGSGGCIGQTATSTTVVDWDVTPTVSAGSNILVCTGSGVGIVQTGATAGGQYGTVAWTTSSTQYGTGNWNNGGTNPAAWTFTPTSVEGFIIAQLQVNGNANCTGNNVTDTRVIQWSTNPTITSVTVTDQTDCNGPNGTIIVVASGNGPLTYSSDNGTAFAPLDTILGLSLGTYDIVVQDSLACSTTYASNSVSVGGPTPVVASSVVVTTNNICAGGTAGVITITGMSGGGGGPFEYGLEGLAGTRWLDATSDPFPVDSLAASTYDVVIRDQFGCMSVVYQRTVTEPSQITINSLNITDIIGCGSSGTGAIAVTASGGTGTLNYYLDSTLNVPGTSGTWSGLPGGSYEVMVSDANNCNTIAEARINAPWTVTAGRDIYNCGTSSTTLSGEVIGQLPTDCTPTCASGCGIPTHCAAQGNNLSDDWISRVNFNTIDNNTGSTYYSNYTGLSTTVNRGSSYTLNLTISKNFVWTQCVSAFFDWNRDGDFTDAGERLDLGCSGANPQYISQSITIPATATLGNTRMRIFERYNSYPPTNGCGNPTYAEVEDYTTTVIGFNTACSATYSWSPSGGTALTGTVTPSSTSTYTLTVDDGDGCIQNDAITVNVSTSATTTSQTNVDCFGNSNGCVTLNPTNGIQPYLLYGPSSTVQVYGGSMRPITVNNTSGSAYTNHPVKITVPFSSGMRADFGDLRFYNTSQVKLNYWIESYTLSTTCDVWIKLPSMPTGNSTVYMTYGNTTLTNAGDGDGVFEFFDEFNSFDASKWTQGTIAATTGSNWSYYGGSLVGGNTNRIQTSATLFTGNRITEARTFELSSANNGYTSAGFYAAANNGFNILVHNGTNYVRRDGGWTNFGGWGGAQRNTWIREYVRHTGANSYASRTREIGGSINVTYSVGALSNERVRLGSRGDNWASNQNYSAQWDWLFVRPYISAEPTITLGTIVTSDNQFCGYTPGTYNFNVVDVAGCNNSLSATITQPSAALAVSITMTEVGCYVTSDGTVDLTASGGTQVSPPPAYYYTWAGPSSFSATTEDLSGVQTGVYNVTVADDNSCTVSSSITVTQLAPINPPAFTWKGC
ncbi:MAG: DUF2341 domain-containing protein, partial [Flavobacteriales bacterium]|nr:DUF2341 domain-containing protein [Flavobacteriales bacterium]